MANQTPEQKFVNCSARTNLFEIQAGKLVESKASNDRVKQIARRMIDDHTKAQDDLKQTAQKNNLRVPERLLAWQQAKLDFISKLPAEDLEVGYSFHLVASHHMALLETEHALQKIQDAGLKQLAKSQLRELRDQLRQANGVAMAFTGGGDAGITGEPVSPSGEKNQEQPTGQNK